MCILVLLLISHGLHITAAEALQEFFNDNYCHSFLSDWTSSLTPPSPVAAAASPPSTTSDAFSLHHQYCHSPIEEHFDVVDGIKPPLQPQQSPPCFTHEHSHNPTTASTTQFAGQHQQQQQRQAYTFGMDTATATTPPPKGGIETPSGGAHHYSYNNNLLYCASGSTVTTTAAAALPIVTRGAISTSYHHHHHHPHYATSNISNSAVAFPPSPASSNLSTPTEATEHYGIGGHHDVDIDAAAVNELSQRLQSELRAAKSRHLSCTEVSLPWDLTPRIAADMIKTSEREPCGVRGCAIFIDFEDETGNAR